MLGLREQDEVLNAILGNYFFEVYVRCMPRFVTDRNFILIDSMLEGQDLRKIPRFVYRSEPTPEITKENLLNVYKSWIFTSAAEQHLRIARLVTAINFTTMELSLSIHTQSRRQSDKSSGKKVSSQVKYTQF